MLVLPCPGKCLAQAATPAAWRPATAAAACLATSAVSAPNDLVPITGLSAAVFTSTDGARLRLTPSSARSAPRAWWIASVSATSSTAPRAALPGYGDPVWCAILVTSPPSSSIAIRGSPAASRSSAISPASCAWLAMFGPKKVTPASPSPSADSTQAGVDDPGDGGISSASASRARPGSAVTGEVFIELSLHSAGHQTADQPAPHQQEEQHHRDRVERGRGHDRPPLGAASAEEVGHVDRQRVERVRLA